ncbi:MAG: DUF5058 family protein [Spirochaetales bacterium]|nr:DUF5058 family protein [Spirochaetales bacterium]
MKNYLDFANKPVLMIAAAVVIIFVFLQAGLFLFVAWKRGKSAGIDSQRMRKALGTGITTSIIPALPIVMTLIAITPVIGTPISWMRLSVIGSAPYELMAAGIGAKTMGVTTLGGEGFTPTVFANAAWIMCIGSFWSIMIVSIFYKGLKKRYTLGKNGDTKWRESLTGACFMGVFAIFMASPITTGGISLVTFLISAVIMLVCLLIILKFKFEKLKEFALTISMLGAMAGCVLWNILTT